MGIMICIIWIAALLFGTINCVNGLACVQDPGLPPNSIVTVNDGRTVARYQCKEGFYISGNSVKQCVNGEWMNAVSCDEITCKYVETPTYGRIKNEVTYQIGSFIEFECYEGYQLQGNSRYLCGANGEWRYTVPASCKPIKCPELSGIPYGSIFQDSSDGIRDDYMSKAEYTCQRGYRLFGKKLKIVRTCELNGQWSGPDPYCEAPVCDDIRPFDGGKVHYSGGKRTENALAFLTCEQGYSFYPHSVEHTKCKESRNNEFDWTPKPTKCMKKHDAVVPVNCKSRSTGELTHMESYVLLPNEGYEFYNTNSYLNNQNRIEITNLNGTLDPPVPQCVPERCKTWGMACNHLSVNFPNGSSTDVKVDSHTEYILKLEDRYEFEGEIYRNINSIERRCEYGHFLNVPQCTEKSCYLTNNDLVLQSFWSNSLLKVAHNEKVTISCKSKDNEMYSSSSKDFPKPFNTQCIYGQFNKEVNSLQCLPKRCDVSQVNHGLVKYINGQKAQGKVKSHTSYTLTLDPKYDFDGDKYINITSIVRRCENGRFLNVPNIVEKRCYLTNRELEFKNQQAAARIDHNREVLVRCKLQTHVMLRGDIYLTPFNIRCQYGQFNPDVNSIKCVPKPCDPELLTNTQVLYTDGTPAAGLIKSDDTFYKLKCEANHEFQNYPHVEFIERQCEYGEFKNVSECIGKQCTVLYPDTNVRYKRPEDNTIIPNNTKLAHLTKAHMMCSSGYELFNLSINRFPSKEHILSTTSMCMYGELSDLTCKEERCKIQITSADVYCYIKNSNSGCLPKDINIRNGKDINLLCKGNYTLQRRNKATDVRTGKTAKMRCTKGHLSPEYDCHPKPCKKPELSNATTNYGNNEVTSGDKIVYKCKKRHHIAGTNDKTQWIGDCMAGFIKDVPTGCIPDNCGMPDLKDGILKVIGSEELFTNTIIPHGLQLTLECTEGFELVNSKNKIMNTTLATFKCDRGSISDKYYCKRCKQNVPDGNQTTSSPLNTDQNSPISQHVQDKMICVEIEDIGCTINESNTYKYFDGEANIIQLPHTVKNGAKITVECNDPIVVYDYYEDTPSENITCMDGILPPVVMVCQDTLSSTDACEAFQLINGNVSKLSIEKYKVTCNPGYKLNIPDALNENCECFNGEVECVPGQKLKCEAEHCRIPLDGDQRLSVYENVGASAIVLSPGETVNNKKYAFFNCSNVFEHRYEPFNRRFKCVRGQWIEADRNPEWTLGNNGAFPECREAKCDPPCSNGGICYKDGECQCSHMTAGSRCEIILCDDSCRLNGGECVRPGVCGNCPSNRRGNNCEIKITCELPAIAARYMNQRRIFPSGETIHSSDMGCQEGYEKSNIKTMTCQQNGTWTGIVECLNNNFKYVVRLQSGNVPYAGTTDNMFLVIHGEHGQTATFKMGGGISRNVIHEKEFRGLDVRPIQKVVLTKDEGIFGGDASISYVSIFIDVDDTYYVLRHPPTETAVWLTVSSGLEFTLSKRPERCIHSYEQGINRKPIDRKYGIHIGWESLRGCKQQCVIRTSITCKSVYFMPGSGRMGHCYIFRHLPESNYFTNNSNKETRRKYLSYRRVCTNHGNM